MRFRKAKEDVQKLQDEWTAAKQGLEKKGTTTPEDPDLEAAQGVEEEAEEGKNDQKRKDNKVRLSK